MDAKHAPPATVDEYVAGFPPEVQQVLEQLRKLVKESVPNVEERISYNMPAYSLGRPLFSFAAWKKHIAFYPRTAGMQAIPGFSALPGTKGSVHFPLDRPMPYVLIREIVKVRLAETQAE